MQTQTTVQRYKQIPIHYYEAIHNHYQNGNWISEKTHLFKSTKTLSELVIEDVAKAIGVTFTQDEDCIWWDTIDIGKKINDIPEVINSLDDTQKIRVFRKDPEELVTQAFNNIEGGNIKFAYLCFNKLIRDNYKLDELAIQLEDVCHQYPAEVDLWLILVEVYKKLGLEEKSLEALEKAQNNLSF